MKNPQWEGRTPDELTGSPELFATNLLLVRAIDNQINRIIIEKLSAEIIVQLHHPDKDYEEETLTEDTSTWSDIRERFKDITEFDDSAKNKGILKPKIPASKTLDRLEVQYDTDTIDINLHF